MNTAFMKHLLMAVALTGMAASLPAMARPDDITENPQIEAFKKLDVNKDGVLSVKEAGKDSLFNTTHFAKADLNKSGTLDQQEYMDYKSAEQNKEVERIADDSVITASIKAAILKEEGFKGLQISVETHRGVVLLSGFVDAQAQVSTAERLAKETTGVISVKNSLIVKR
ncbi:transport-associated protein [Methylovorus sp. MP688]|uniref:Transport-associated n=2 Tax=Methylovorus TaxID=81682 RepID=C6XCV4_METGS|nr:BON domain-containing protein [Methylovorus glucosotrophus]ACT50379.1 transport-associated [Methylovorus glucosotrophus SIP3-4]ADQ84359.1 transport-associated protein [Methylovorus sp. MP688]